MFLWHLTIIFLIGKISSTQLNDTTLLRVVLSEYPVTLMVKRDANQNVLSTEGVTVEMLQWMTEFGDFSYSFPPIYSPAVENTSSGGLGYIYYIHTDKADLILGSLISSPFRYQFIDFPHPWMQESAVLVIPLPDISVNIGSIWQPFQLSVWISISVSIPLIILFLYIGLCSPVTPQTDQYYNTNRTSKLGLYVFGLLLSQGGFLRSSRLANRLIAGVWCLATFVLVQAYSSTLISFVTTPTSTPLVKSPEELANQGRVQLVVIKYVATEVILLSSQDPLLKKLGDKLRTYPKSRCNRIEECLDLVASGDHVLIHGYGAVLAALNEDYQKTRKCRFAFAKNILSSRSYSWGLQKKSPVIETFNRGILQMTEKGLVKKWNDHFQPKPFKCMDQLGGRIRTSQTGRQKVTKLNLNNFLGAFLFLVFGYCLSITVFFFEHLF